jgi:agmatine deiminase
MHRFVVFGMGCFVFLSSQAARAEERFLPNWFSPELETSDNLPPVFSSSFVVPNAFRVPAEYEPVGSVVLGWRGATDFLAEIARVVANEGNANVVVADGPESIKGVSAGRYHRAECPLDTLWVRDYGPIGLSIDTREVGFVDAVYRHYSSRRNDDALPSCLGKDLKTGSFSVDLILDGGNFLMDSAGNLFMTNRTYSWNSSRSKADVDAVLKKTYAAKKIHVLEYAGSPGNPKDGTGHIDMYVKLLSSDTVLISEAPTEPFRSAVAKAVTYFGSIKTPDGQDYKIIRVPGWYENETWYTYTNSLVVNGVALVPQYQYYPEQNALAQKAYEQAGFMVKMISSDRTIGQGGSIHCVTQTIPAVDE